jgi:hypothetical protein
VLTRERRDLVFVHFVFLIILESQAGADSLAQCGLRQRVIQELSARGVAGNRPKPPGDGAIPGVDREGRCG